MRWDDNGESTREYTIIVRNASLSSRPSASSAGKVAAEVVVTAAVYAYRGNSSSNDMATITIYKCSTLLSIIIILHFRLAYLSCSPPHRLYRPLPSLPLHYLCSTSNQLDDTHAYIIICTWTYSHNVHPPKEASVLHFIPIIFIIYFFFHNSWQYIQLFTRGVYFTYEDFSKVIQKPQFCHETIIIIFNF